MDNTSKIKWRKKYIKGDKKKTKNINWDTIFSYMQQQTRIHLTIINNNYSRDSMNNNNYVSTQRQEKTKVKYKIV